MRLYWEYFATSSLLKQVLTQAEQRGANLFHGLPFLLARDCHANGAFSAHMSGSGGGIWLKATPRLCLQY